MTRKQKRLAGITGMMAVVGLATGLVLTALSDSAAYFRSPTDLMGGQGEAGQRIRLGGIVETGSVERGTGSQVRFRVTDTVESVPVVFTGLLPDLFREGQGVVTEGMMGPDRVFAADSVLAKHDETYMPREVVEDLKARGLWQEGDGAPPVGEGASLSGKGGVVR